jgi:hypothetical protein
MLVATAYISVTYRRADRWESRPENPAFRTWRD